jgi:hypothetical protein
VRTSLRRLLPLAVVIAALGTGSAQAAATDAVAHVSAAKTCSSRYVHAYLSWGEKCLAPGQFCKVGNREYRRYGLVCPASGHLRYR